MGKKYSSQTSSTYADDTPADDGSKVETNRVSINLIRTNYTDPIKDLADNINTALVDHFDNGPRAVTSTDATIATDYGKIIQCTGTLSLSLLAATTAGAGYTVTIKNTGTGTVTLIPASGDTVDSVTNGTVAIKAQEARGLVVNAAATGYMTTSAYEESPTYTTLTVATLNATTGVTLGGGSDVLNTYDHNATFTPVVADASSAGNTATGTFSGAYMKTGRGFQCTLSLTDIDTTGLTAGNTLFIRNFPFTFGTGLFQYGTLATSQVTLDGYPLFRSDPSTTYGRCIFSISNNTANIMLVSDITSGSGDLFITLNNEMTS